MAGTRLLMGAALLLLAACDAGERSSAGSSVPVPPIHESGELVVLTRNAPTSYFIDRHDQPAGFEYELASRFADHLGVKVRFEIRHSISAIKEALRHGEGHLVAAGMTRIPSREAEFLFGPGYFEVQQQLVCRRGGNQPADLEGLTEVSLLVMGESSYEDLLKTLRAVRLPDLTWESDPELPTELALRKVWEHEVDCTLADSNIVSLNRRFYPELRVIMAMGEPQELAWMLTPDAEVLHAELEDWFPEVEASGFLDDLSARYYEHVALFDYVDTALYIRRINERLPAYRELFERAGEQYDIDWRLLAAQSYQESHWEPRARSPTGVRGLMMLTQRTAAELGVDNRLDPEQSIMGGARYLASLRERLPESITEPDRTWIALAAYNVGMHHIYDARRLARHYERDPDSWHALRDMLPKLERPEYYRFLPTGYARGNEPVLYQQRIRNYLDLLERHLAGECVAEDGRDDPC